MPKPKAAKNATSSLEALARAAKWTPKLVDAAFAEHGPRTLGELAPLLARRDLFQKDVASDACDYLLVHVLDHALDASPLVPLLEPIVRAPASDPVKNQRFEGVRTLAMLVFARDAHPALRPQLALILTRFAHPLDAYRAPFALHTLAKTAAMLGDPTLAPLFTPLFDGLPYLTQPVAGVVAEARGLVADLAAGKRAQWVSVPIVAAPAPARPAVAPYRVVAETDEPTPPADTEEGRLPGAFAVLRCDLHLEPLVFADRQGIASALAVLREALGDRLAYTVDSRRGARVVRHRSEHFDDLVDGVAFLTPESDAKATPLMRATAETPTGGPWIVDVAFKGPSAGDDAPGEASPWTLSFYSEVAYPRGAPYVPTVPALLSFSVPLTFPRARFQNLVARVASSLRVRWGNAGLGYATWSYLRHSRGEHELHAAQHPSFDRGDHEGHMPALLECVRSVSWLTLVGAVLWARLPEASRDALVADFDVSRVDACVMVRVPTVPDAGACEVPDAYARVDALIRAIRLHTIDESYAGESRGLPGWLKRFETHAPSV